MNSPVIVARTLPTYFAALAARSMETPKHINIPAALAAFAAVITHDPDFIALVVEVSTLQLVDGSTVHCRAIARDRLGNVTVFAGHGRIYQFFGRELHPTERHGRAS